MNYALTVVEASPVVLPEEPVSLFNIEQSSRIDFHDDDGEQFHIECVLIPAAREYAEKIQNVALVRQTWLLNLDAFPCGRIIEIPLRPVASVTSISYVDADGIEQTLNPSAYTVDTKSFRPRIELKASESWPTTEDCVNAVSILFEGGYIREEIPMRTKQAMILLVSHWYENREAMTLGEISREIEFAVTALLNADRAIPI
jgi:uncharacterized phiE125 gp8 family phage protein